MGFSRKERALDEELKFHLEMSIEKKMASGMSEKAARKEALREFGSLDLVKEEIRDNWTLRFTGGVLRDLRLGMRQMWAHKLITFVVVMTLGLSIGCNTAIFSTLNELAIKGLPFKDSNRLVEIYNSYGQDDKDREGNNLTNYLAYSKLSDDFESVSLRESAWVTATWEGKMLRTQMYKTTVEFFETLAVKPLVGDFFDETHRLEGGRRVVVLNYGFWLTHFGGQADALGRSILIEGESHEIIGVAPQSISSLDTSVGFFVPWQWQEGNVDTDNRIPRYMNYGQLWARMAPEASLVSVRTKLNALNGQHLVQLAEVDNAMLQRMGHRLVVDTVKNERIKGVKGSLLLLQLAAGLILLIGCVNVSNILLARANERQTEFGIRSALGAGRGALFRQVLVELFLMAVVACVLGIGAGAYGIHLINTKTTNLLPPIEGVYLDGMVVLGTIGFSLLAVFLCGALSSWRIFWTNVSEALKSGGRAASASRFSRKASAWLISGQCAAAFGVTVGAGLLWMSLHRAVNTDPGFDSENVATLRVFLPWQNFERWQLPGYRGELERILEENPEVENFAFSSNVPSFGYNRSLVFFPDRILEKGLEQPKADMSMVSPTYFDAMGMRLLSGRGFANADVGLESEPMIVDTLFVEKHFSGESPLGRKIHLGGLPSGEEQWATIVGVVESARNLSLDNSEAIPFVYRILRPRQAREYSVFIKTRTPVARVLEKVGEEISRIDPNVVPFRMGTLDMYLEEALMNRKSVLMMIAVFAILALGLSATGIYGSLAHDVSQREKELSIRSALGAPRSFLFRSVVWDGVKRVAIGLAIGLIIALVIGKMLSGMLYAVNFTDPVIYLGIGGMMLLIGMIASVAPAMRAIRIRALDAVRAD